MSDASLQYLDGFRAANGLPPRRAPTPPPEASAGRVPLPAREETLSATERIKRELHPLDALPRLLENARENRPPSHDDAFRFRWFGLFYEGPEQDAYRLRVRLPEGRLRAFQLEGLAALTQDIAGGCVVCNAQGGLDLPGIAVRDAPEALRRVEEIGWRTLLAGGDCVRAVRGGEHEGLTDRRPVVRPLVRELEQVLALNRRLSDLPGGVEIVLRAFDEARWNPEPHDHALVLHEIDEAKFSLAVSGFGPLEVIVAADRVVAVCLELLGRWAAGGDRSEGLRDGLTGFCTEAGNEQIRAWLVQVAGPLATPTPQAPATVPERRGGVDIPGGRLLSGALVRLGGVARAIGGGEVRLVDGQLHLRHTDDRGAAGLALREALGRATLG